MNTLILMSVLCFGADPEADAKAALAEVEQLWEKQKRSHAPRPPIISEHRQQTEEGPDNEPDPFAPENKRRRPLIEVKATTSPVSLVRRVLPVPPMNREAMLVRMWSPPARQSVQMSAPRRFISAPMMSTGFGSSSRMMGMGSRMMLRGGSRSGGCST